MNKKTAGYGKKIEAPGNLAEFLPLLLRFNVNKSMVFLRYRCAHVWSVGLLLLLAFSVSAQYSDNPLRGKRWYTAGAGLNTADYWSWQGMLSYSKRGEGSLVQTRFAFTQELWMAPNDSCTEKHNKLFELGLMWGDGWGGKRWYATGSVGFGFNMRMYCRKNGYDNEYITGLTLGVPLQIEAGVLLGKQSGISIIGLGNWNFRQPYLGAQLAFYRMLNK